MALGSWPSVCPATLTRIYDSRHDNAVQVAAVTPHCAPIILATTADNLRTHKKCEGDAFLNGSSISSVYAPVKDSRSRWGVSCAYRPRHDAASMSVRRQVRITRHKTHSRMLGLTRQRQGKPHFDREVETQIDRIRQGIQDDASQLRSSFDSLRYGFLVRVDHLASNPFTMEA